MDKIEDIFVSTDEDGFVLTLTGDFIDSCEKYIENNTQVKLRLLIPHHILRDLPVNVVALLDAYERG